ncbi:hypothetical protein, partial [Helicobacter sp. 13S00482-2]|uniref:hypothetical protein n=1 Tax=Helicobacter sp. 13S00482-2 TaxID=1476200 RepID=UPI001C5F935F
HIYLIDGIYYLFILPMPSILFVFAFGKLCISCFKSIKNKIHRVIHKIEQGEEKTLKEKHTIKRYVDKIDQKKQ